MSLRVGYLALGFLTSALLFPGPAAWAQTCVPNPLPDVGAYSVFVLGGASFNTGTVDGRVALGGDAQLTAVEIGPDRSGLTGDALVVGGALVYDGGTVHGGDIVWGGSASLTGVTIPDGVSRQGTPVDFAARGTALIELSDHLAGLSTTGQATLESGGFGINRLRLSGTATELEVFRVNASQLQTVTEVVLQTAAGASVLIDVVDDNPFFARQFPLVWTGVPTGRLVVNYATHTFLDVVPLAHRGTLVLAPRAKASFNLDNPFGADSLDGMLVAGSLSGGGRVIHVPFVGCLPLPQVPNAPPTISILEPADGELVSTREVLVKGVVEDDRGPITVTLDGRPATVTGETFAAVVSLREGPQTLTAQAADGELTASDSVELVLDSIAPALEVFEPDGDGVVNTASVAVRGRVTDAGGPVTLRVDGQALAVGPSGDFATTLALGAGSQVIEIEAVDPAGNVATVRRALESLPVPELVVSSPAPFTLITTPTVTVTGQVSDAAAEVRVEGELATVDPQGFFERSGVPVAPGQRLLEVQALTPGGALVVEAVPVVRDALAPRILLDTEWIDGTTRAATATITGRLLDLGPDSGVGVPELTVNGTPVPVLAGSFAHDLTLSPGANTVILTARDASGNESVVSTEITRLAAAGRSMTVSAGTGQQGAVGTTLADPFELSVFDDTGQPVADVPILVSVADSDGGLSAPGAPTEEKRRLLVRTDSQGTATVLYRLGSRAGVQKLRAFAPGYGDEPIAAVGTAGPPAQIFVDGGGVQTGRTQGGLPEPLTAVVTDARGNRLSGVPVRFRVVRGDGRLGGQSEATRLTDATGRASIPFTLGTQPGAASHVVEAYPEGLPGVIAPFVASALPTGPPAATVIRGLVLDNSDRPVPGVTVGLHGLPIETQTDAEGRFRFTAAPSGHQLLDVDASTTTRPGLWPHLEFDLFVVPGQVNQLPRPIYVLPLEQEGLAVGPAQGGTLTLPDIPGLALTVEPGAVTFPDGTTEGVVTVSVVHADKIPMVPNFGQQPRLVLTVQPAGARFDPPARLSLPNTDGLEPGISVELFSFDHDQARFVTIGTATVADDGVALVSDPGMGIVKAGWHAAAPPAPAGTPHDCPPGCQIADTSQCVPGCSASAARAEPLNAPLGAACTCTEDDLPPCQINPRCVNGRCVGDPVAIEKIEGACVAAQGEPTTFTAISQKADDVEWIAPRATPQKGQGETFETTFSLPDFTVVVAQCPAGDKKTKTIYVGPACGSVTPELVFNEEVGFETDQGNHGQVDDDFELSFEGCAESDEWCFRLETYEVDLFIGVDTESRVDISAVDDPDVTAANCAAVIDDLTPKAELASLKTGNAPRPAMRTYTSSPITLEHERVHVQDLKDIVYEPSFLFAQQLAMDSEYCTECFEARPPDALYDEFFKDFRRREHQDFGGNGANAHERRAYEETVPLYENLVNGIRARAQAEGWPAECR